MNQEALYDLIKGCNHNKRDAQEALYKHFYADMYRVGERYTEDPHEALSIVNDAFLKVFKSIAQYNRELGNFKAWLKTIVVNTAIDHIRQQKKNLRLIHIDQVQEQGDDDFQLNYQWKEEELLQHLKLLPAVTRMVINLFAFDGYSYKDISEHLDISETTCRWHVAEARKRLRASLQLNTRKMVKYE